MRIQRTSCVQVYTAIELADQTLMADSLSLQLCYPTQLANQTGCGVAWHQHARGSVVDAHLGSG